MIKGIDEGLSRPSEKRSTFSDAGGNRPTLTSGEKPNDFYARAQRRRRPA